MREIKFRAWGNEFDRLKPEYQMYPVTKVDMTITGDKIYRIGVQRPIGKEPTYLADDYKLMQYTGLKDKNGKEIYEGDILGKRPYGYFKKDSTKDGRYKGREWDCFAVEWGHWDNAELGLASGWEYEEDGKVAGWNITFGHRWDEDDELKTYEVIGNIWENADLLK